MKNIIKYLLGIMLLVLLCTSCQSKELPDTYVEGSDYQYMQMEGGFHFTLTRTQGSKGMYILHGNYIYFIDAGSNAILPLCNKVDCLHDKETDSEKYSYCNACLLPQNGVRTGTLGISYCNGSLYCLDSGYAGQAFLYRISEDGSKKEEIYKWENCLINEWLIHRDVLYYMKQAYEKVNGTIKESHQVLALSLTDPLKEEWSVFVPSEDLDVVTLGKPKAYGNHLYFKIIAYAPAKEEITNDNYLQYLYYKTFVYDILNNQITELLPPTMSPSEYMSQLVFWDDKLLLTSSDLSSDDTVSSDYYIAELDGSNPELFMKDIPYYYKFASDGIYLYLTNVDAVVEGSENEDVIIYEVYNKEREKIDVFQPTTKLRFYGILPLGTNAMYLQYSSGDENDPSWGIVRWDKQIATYHGEPIDKDIVDIPR